MDDLYLPAETVPFVIRCNECDLSSLNKHSPLRLTALSVLVLDTDDFGASCWSAGAEMDESKQLLFKPFYLLEVLVNLALIPINVPYRLKWPFPLCSKPRLELCI